MVMALNAMFESLEPLGVQAAMSVPAVKNNSRFV
jgi:hypothetical protein